MEAVVICRSYILNDICNHDFPTCFLVCTSLGICCETYRSLEEAFTVKITTLTETEVPRIMNVK